jgi:hypothetical protein
MVKSVEVSKLFKVSIYREEEEAIPPFSMIIYWKRIFLVVSLRKGDLQHGLSFV